MAHVVAVVIAAITIAGPSLSILRITRHIVERVTPRFIGGAEQRPFRFGTIASIQITCAEIIISVPKLERRGW